MKYGIQSHKTVYTIFLVLIIFTLLRQWSYGSWHGMRAMSDFMGGFFLIFGFFKVIDLKGFVQAYKAYNLLAEHISLYAWLFPFIQIGIGIAYLLRIVPFYSNVINFTIMTIGFISVLIKLIQKQVIPCACLGTLFKHPLSLVSLSESGLMVGMSLFMLLYHTF